MSLKIKNIYLFCTIALSFIILAFLFSEFIITPENYFKSYKDALEISKINEIISRQSKSQWLLYLYITILTLIKCTLVSITLQIGLLLNNRILKFADTFAVALMAEAVFLLPQLIKLAWFLLIETDYTLTDIQQFYPLSALNLFKIENLSALLIYPFQTLNVFEVLYWIVLAGGIKQALNTDINHGIRVVFSGYIPALLLWVVCVMFITVSVSPAT